MKSLAKVYSGRERRGLILRSMWGFILGKWHMELGWNDQTPQNMKLMSRGFRALRILGEGCRGGMGGRL